MSRRRARLRPAAARGGGAQAARQTAVHVGRGRFRRGHENPAREEALSVVVDVIRAVPCARDQLYLDRLERNSVEQLQTEPIESRRLHDERRLLVVERAEDLLATAGEGQDLQALSLVVEYHTFTVEAQVRFL